MLYTILLSKNDNAKQVEAEEQTRFVMTIIEALEIPFEWNSNEPLTISDKIRLRKILDDYNVDIVDDTDGRLKIFVNREQIAEWRKCKYKLKEDISQIDPKKRHYLEMTVDFSSIYEEP